MHRLDKGPEEGVLLKQGPLKGDHWQNRREIILWALREKKHSPYRGMILRLSHHRQYTSLLHQCGSSVVEKGGFTSFLFGATYVKKTKVEYSSLLPAKEKNLVCLQVGELMCLCRHFTILDLLSSSLSAVSMMMPRTHPCMQVHCHKDACDKR